MSLYNGLTSYLVLYHFQKQPVFKFKANVREINHWLINSLLIFNIIVLRIQIAFEKVLLKVIAPIVVIWQHCNIEYRFNHKISGYRLWFLCMHNSFANALQLPQSSAKPSTRVPYIPYPTHLHTWCPVASICHNLEWLEVAYHGSIHMEILHMMQRPE